MPVGGTIAVASLRGGGGRSFVAANLASAIREESRRPVLLVDCTLPVSRDCAFLLEMDSPRFLAPLLPVVKSLGVNMLRTYPCSHPSGIALVGLADSSTDTAAISFDNHGADIAHIIRTVGCGFYATVIDCGCGYNPFVAALLHIVDQVVIPTDDDAPSLMKTRETMAVLHRNNFPGDSIHFVLNGIGAGKKADSSSLLQKLGKKPLASIPHVPNLYSMISGGRTFPKDHPDHPVSRALSIITLELMRKKSRLSAAPSSAALRPDSPDYVRIKETIHQEIQNRTDLKDFGADYDKDPVKLDELRQKIRDVVAELFDSEARLQDMEIRSRISREILQEALGLGPLEDLLADPSISEIMVNRFDEIFVERQGKLHRFHHRFLSERQLLQVIERIVAAVGRRIDLASPLVDARLQDGSRVNAIIPPLALRGASLTIRKFSQKMIGIDELVQFGTCSRQIVELLKAAVLSRLNIVVSGGTGSGKTTLLNLLSSFIPDEERIITIEDSAELQLRQTHVVSLEARPPNIEGKGEITIRDLVKNALRMRPDRIVIGECRSGEALDMLQAMNTGHDGSLTTLHANSSREALQRMETLVMFAGFDMPSRAIREQIAAAVDILVQLDRLKDGTRKIMQVTEVNGMERDVITTGDIFKFEPHGVDEAGKVVGDFVSTGYVPSFVKQFEENGITIHREIFWKSA